MQDRRRNLDGGVDLRNEVQGLGHGPQWTASPALRNEENVLCQILELLAETPSNRVQTSSFAPVWNQEVRKDNN